MVKWKTYRKGLDHKNLWEITYIVQIIKKTKHKKKNKKKNSACKNDEFI